MGSEMCIRDRYISILLELGIVGIALIAGGIVWLFIYEVKHKYIINSVAMSAHLISLCFFAGLPNALHIYLLTPMLAKSRDEYFMVKYENEQVNRRSTKKRSKS